MADKPTLDELLKQAGPLPWEVNNQAGRPYREIFSDNCLLLDCGVNDLDAVVVESTAELVVRAVNALPLMRELVESMCNEHDKGHHAILGNCRPFCSVATKLKAMLDGEINEKT